MSFACSLLPLNGFHFEYSTNVSLANIRSECDLYLLYVLPPDVFVDKYELEERNVVFTLHGESDLELPLTAVDPAGSTLEIQINPPLHDEFNVKIPLHARYPRPSALPCSTVHVPEPQGFWACPTSNKSKDNPFSYISSPYTPSFNLDTRTIIFFDRNQRERYFQVQVPAGRPSDVMIVEFGTAFVVLVAFFYIARAAWKTATRLRGRTNVKRD